VTKKEIKQNDKGFLLQHFYYNQDLHNVALNESGSFGPDYLFAPGRFAPESESIRPT